MTAALALLALLGAANPPDSAADVVTLRDGKVVLGQVVDAPAKGRVSMVVRRAWAEKALPDRFKTWTAAEGPAMRKAKAERIARLDGWKADRQNDAGDPIVAWIDAEVARMMAGADIPPLMLVSINRNDIKAMTRRPPDVARKLRQAWRVKFDDAETKPAADLAASLEGRGFAATGTDPVAIDDLLPVPPEPENKWRARRAATEVAQERGLRFLKAQGMVIAEPAPGEAPNPLGAVNGLVKSLLGDAPAEDPLEAKGREVAARGRMGMLVTSLETAEDASGVAVEIVLYAHMPNGRWERVAAKTARVRSADVKPGEDATIANDPQVQSVIKAAEGLGIAIPEDVKRQGLAIGVATQKALGQVRSAIQPDLDALELPVAAGKK